ncbi:hypothetical protein ACIQM4_02525 [Streptomyces sp. NPDC091272]|uniref:hypothetical protein n=1 Tax=Streptomyces sp. NPDC091272 TaxID=3365981 RepID=UPI0038163EE7
MLNHKQLQLGAAAVIAAVALGAAAPAASAQESVHTARTVGAPAGMSAAQAQAQHILSSPQLRPHLSGTGRALLQAAAGGDTRPEIQRGAVNSAAKAAFGLIKKAGGKVLSGASNAAKKGVPAFKKWADGLAWYHPVRLAVAALGGEGIKQLVSLLAG